MKVIGIHDGHCATACYLKDGKIISLVSEERFTNVKNQGGFPIHSLKWILTENKLSIEEIDKIALGSYAMWDWGHEDEIVYNNRLRSSILRLSKFFPKSILGSNFAIDFFLFVMKRSRRKMINRYCSKYNLDVKKIEIVEHHSAHALSALYGSGFTNSVDSVLIFTSDASGDGLSNTVSTWKKSEGYKRIQFRSAFHSLGMIYAEVTKFLGMRANEHEYKIMGMAPYVPLEYSERAFKKFKEYIDFDPESGEIINKKGSGNLFLESFKEDFYRERFDNICAGIQRHFEYIIISWIKYWVEKTGIQSVVFGGGSFMNVKGNMLIYDLKEVKNLFICPSCGDESIALGASYKVALELGEKELHPIETLYLGPEYSDRSIIDAITKNKSKLEYKLVKDIETEIARLLSKGMIVARFQGKSEWGARALGNRSILCRGDDPRVIHKLNKSIKMRDFWMPFAASMLEEDSKKYLDNSRNIVSRFMMLTFRTKSPSNYEIFCGLHPYDFTCRPQMVSKESNPAYFRLLTKFKALTGISGLVNTSFNLHGFPIVGTPEVALNTLISSKIDYLAIGSYLIWRKDINLKLK
ncbi:carbamoyl transferase [Leptospira ryugenii]|uniref:Carbamoyl transferase n=1 Tax=Leptospira ryugenii TaxID=1917863 RepID=A0A2P2DW19_9LEPT|nr:carbamoyltransferase C-terminal domain-containing protein [Leptospira ryugenii]GBF48838.1 carbamoyl transferase [Leptospira ryugenii]